ncbi:AfsR/SARP family transcriptional regulator [Nonomuraea indica]|uniref:AfsR/SARP family transcriptional regulator n=1 Tax=Nonomuraea indica TaxID=1581193 RepID=UPI000C795AC2|nr:BTAD domain-containing putative transcriptional regulator [Nonomuraea indica]
MDIRILGPLEASRGNFPIKLGGPRQQTVLAMLLLGAEKVIPVARLIEAVWGDDPPSTAREQIQICVSGLRRAFVGADGEKLLCTHSPGYVLRLDGCTLDARVCEARVREGREALSAGDPAAAAACLRGALSLWRGAALSSVSSAVVQQSVAHLNERRLSVLEECVEIELNAGLSHDLVGELVALTQEHPLRERLRALHMTALYRTGRQAEALEVFRNTRAILADELGIEPSSNLQRLHQAMLEGRPLEGRPLADGPARRIDPPPPVEVRPSPGPQPGRNIPMLLPATIPDFTGRAGVIDRMTDLTGTGEAVPVTVLYGRGGAGKTTVAVHTAHRLAARFPDGQLYAQLQSGTRRVDPVDVLGRFLRALGVSGSALPEGGEERAEIYRDLLSKRRMLIVLDDAMSEEQIVPLLPGNPGCSVLVTSRRRLTGLPAARRVEVGTLSPRSSLTLLGRILGQERVEAEREAAERLCELCGCLPLALRIVAARLAARPHWSVATMVERLLDESHRLDELNHGDMGLRASISLSYDALSPQARRLFRLLALSEAPSFAAWVGAPLLQADPLRAEDLLEELTEAYLLDIEHTPAPEPVRYRFHDIMRSFALERLLACESADERGAALERLIGALLFLTEEAHRREYSGDHLLPAGSASRWELPASCAGRVLGNPLSWYRQERTSILAGVRQAAACGLEHAWRLALGAVPLFESQAYFSDWRSTHEVALEAACRAGDVRGEAAMRYSLGSLHLVQRESAEAAAQFERAIRLYDHLGDQHGTALVLRYIAYLDRQNGDLELALSRWEEALKTFQVVHDRVAEAYVLHNMAQVQLDLGAQDEAYALLRRADRICKETGNRRVGAQVRHRLGALYHLRGRLDQAADTYAGVLQDVRESGDRIGACHALLGLAAVDTARGDLWRARRTLTEAGELAASVGDPSMRSRVALGLAQVEFAEGELQAAAAHADRAVHDFGVAGLALLQARALVVRGRIRKAAGSPGAAMADWRTAEVLLSGTRPRAAALRGELDRLTTV